MFLQEIKTILANKLCPKVFKLNSEIYGLHYDKGRKNKLIKKVMLTIDLSLEAIHFAIKHKINLIISYHSLINKPIKNFEKNIINKLSLLSKYPISIFVLNSSLIAAEGGISDTIANVLYLKVEKTFEIRNKFELKIPIGRICLPLKYLNKNKRFTLENLIQRIKANLDLNCVPYVGELTNIISRICIIGGDISKAKYINKALKMGCDCYITGKIDYFGAILARDMGINLIEVSHYKTEIVAMKRLNNILSLECPEIEFILFESKDPFKTYI